jgi:hypothetical protein
VLWFHVNVGAKGTLVAPAAGVSGVGGAGGAMIVVKFPVVEKALVPPAFVALTRQKYCVSFNKPLTLREVATIAESFTIVVEKLEAVETCNRYSVAPDDTFHDNVGFRETPVESFAGEESVGALGGATIVVNERSVENAPVPPAFFARTRQ